MFGDRVPTPNDFILPISTIGIACACILVLETFLCAGPLDFLVEVTKTVTQSENKC